MESKVKILGHPVHPMLIVFPLGLLATAVVFDILFMTTGNQAFPTVSYYLIAAGVIGGLTAAIFGFIDWLGLPANSRARTIATWHGLGNVLIVVLFLLSWFIRGNNDDLIPNAQALTLSFAGVALALVTGWLGGELVYRLGIGVESGANANAPSSLSNKPATDSASRTKRPVQR